MELTPPRAIVPNISLKTRRRTRSEWLRRCGNFHLRRYQYQHIPSLQEKAGSILLVPDTRYLWLCHRLHRRRLEVFYPQARAFMASIHALSFRRMDHIRTRTASGPLLPTAPGESEPQAPTMGAYPYHRRCVTNDHSDLAFGLAGIQSV